MSNPNFTDKFNWNGKIPQAYTSRIFDSLKFIEPPKKEETESSDGCFCNKCKEFFPYAEPNNDDGTLTCYSCRNKW